MHGIDGAVDTIKLVYVLPSDCRFSEQSLDCPGSNWTPGVLK